MNLSQIGVIGTSKKEDERRVPIHPDHLIRLPQHVRTNLFLKRVTVSPLTFQMKILLLVVVGLPAENQFSLTLALLLLQNPFFQT